MANFKIEPNKGDSGKTNVKVTSETTNESTNNRVLGSVVFTTEDGTEKSVRVYQYGKTIFEAERPNPMASTDTQVSFTVHSWYHGAYSPVNVYTPVGTAHSVIPVGGDVIITISGIPQNPGSTTKTYNVVLTQDATGNTITLPIKHTAEEQPIPVVHTFSVSPTSLVLEEGELGHISCKYDDIAILPELVEFTSADTQIVTVESNGTVTAVKQGTAQITVVYNNTDPDDGNVYTATIPIAVKEAQVEPTTCTVVFSINPADATVKVNNVVLSGYTYTASKGVPFSYEISRPGYITVTGTFTPTENATISIVLVEKKISSISKLSDSVELSYNVPISAAGSSTPVYPRAFNVKFKVLYENGTEETGFYVSGGIVNNQWTIQQNLPYGVNYEFGFTPIGSVDVSFNQTNGVFGSIPENTSFYQRTLGTVNLYLTTAINQSISQVDITQLESTQRIVSSIKVSNSGLVDLKYPNVEAVGGTVLPDYYHIPLVVTYTNGEIDSTNYYLDKNGNNLPDNTIASFVLQGEPLPSTGSVTIVENPKTTVREFPINIVVDYSGNTLIAAQAKVSQAGSVMLVTGNNAVTVGTTTQFTATFNGVNITNTASWSSSNPLIASVGDTGLVTAVDNGNVTIGAVYKESAASKQLTVQSAVTLIVTEANGKSEFEIGEDTQFTLVVETSEGTPVLNATLTHSGEVGDVTINGYNISFNNPGTYTITATYDNMVGTIVFTAIELESLELATTSTTLAYNSSTRFTITGVYNGGLRRDLSSRYSYLQLVSGEDYCDLNSGVLKNTNEDTEHSIINKSAWVVVDDEGVDKYIGGTFIGVPYDNIRFNYAFTNHYNSIAHIAQVKAVSNNGVESNTVSIILNAVVIPDEVRDGFIRRNGDVIATIEDSTVLSEDALSTGAVSTYTLLVITEGAERVSGTSSVTISIDEVTIGTISIVNNPTCCYLCTDTVGTRAVNFTYNPNMPTTVGLRIWNISSLKRRVTVGDDRHGFVRYDGEIEFIKTNNIERSVTVDVNPQSCVLPNLASDILTLTIPTERAISTCTDTYEIVRTVVDKNGTFIEYSTEHSIVITEAALTISNVDIKSFWYPEIALSTETVSPYYSLEITYGQDNIKSFDQDSFDTDFFSHSPANTSLIGFTTRFSISQLYVQGVTINNLTGIVTLPGTETTELAKIEMTAASIGAISAKDLAETVLGERIQLTFRDSQGNEIINRNTDAYPDYYIAKGLNTENGVAKFKVYHKNEDVTTRCTFWVTGADVSTQIPPAVSINNGYVCVTLDNQTGSCSLIAHLTVEGLYTGEQLLRLYFAQHFYIGDDNGTEYNKYRKIEPYGYTTTVPIALWADFEGTLQKITADSWSSSNAALATVAYSPLQYIPSIDAVVTGTGIAGDGIITGNYKNLSVEAGVHCE